MSTRMLTANCDCNALKWSRVSRDSQAVSIVSTVSIVSAVSVVSVVCGWQKAQHLAHISLALWQCTLGFCEFVKAFVVKSFYLKDLKYKFGCVF